VTSGEREPVQFFKERAHSGEMRASWGEEHQSGDGLDVRTGLEGVEECRCRCLPLAQDDRVHGFMEEIQRIQGGVVAAYEDETAGVDLLDLRRDLQRTVDVYSKRAAYSAGIGTERLDRGCEVL